MTTAQGTAPITATTKIEWLRQMLEVRLFEEKVQELFMQGKVQGTTHLCQGQEAVSVGAISAMEPEDYLTITYRGHGHALARGMSMDAAFGEMMGLTSGCCHGVGGSMHLTDFSRNLIGAFAIVGAGYPVAVGAAMSAKLRGTDAAAVTFCGDGATNIGTFHESLNMASTWKAPIVFVVENNLYGEYSPVRQTTPLDDLADRAKAHAMPGFAVDGQDVVTMYETTAAALQRARAGDGPTLIEAKTYRLRGHSRTDPGTYRPREEIEHWTTRDPIRLLGEALAGDGVLSADDQQDLRERIQAEVDASAERAAQAPAPTFEEIKSYVYAS
jgi:acetoin:2,6-dichlorophenolindophenol oxidoreductase subunit alpha